MLPCLDTGRRYYPTSIFYVMTALSRVSAVTALQLYSVSIALSKSADAQSQTSEPKAQFESYLPFGRVLTSEDKSFTYVSVTDPEALNLDGSRYGIAVCLSPTSTDEWWVHAQGGGWCYDEDDCWGRSKTGLGSNKSWPGSAASWHCDPQTTSNYVHMFYGDGASRSGYRKDPWPVPSNPSETLYFRGQISLYAGLREILKRGMNKAKLITFGGDSAGGLTVFLHLDNVVNFLAKEAPDAVVLGNPQCGYFADLYPKYPKEMAYVFNMQNTSGSLPKDCLDIHKGEHAWRCIMAPYVAPLIKNPWFAIQSRFDWWQLLNVLTYPADSDNRMPCLPDQYGGWTYPNNCSDAEIRVVQEYGPKFMGQFGPLMKKQDLNGGFLDQCLAHCIFNSIDGDQWITAYNDWAANVVKRVKPGGERITTEAADFQRWWKYDCDGSDKTGPCAAHPPPNGGPTLSQETCFNLYNNTNTSFF